jgi:hypothetical protein
MTIAACALTPEGVVFGADSTSTLITSDGLQRYLNNEQKVFEVGVDGTLGVVTWGLGRIGTMSHRSIIAALGDDLANASPASVEEAASRFAKLVWTTYDGTLRTEINKQKAIAGDQNAKKEDVEKAKGALENMTLGFCIGGHWLPNREPRAYELTFDVNIDSAPTPKPVGLFDFRFWGANLFVARLLGLDTSAAKAIVASGKWGGNEAELEALLTARKMPINAPLPLRETADAVHALIQTTIKVMKFTSIPPVCGGHVELAVVTTDRRFRWIRHKTLGAALDVP